MKIHLQKCLFPIVKTVRKSTEVHQQKFSRWLNNESQPVASPDGQATEVNPLPHSAAKGLSGDFSQPLGQHVYLTASKHWEKRDVSQRFRKTISVIFLKSR